MSGTTHPVEYYRGIASFVDAEVTPAQLKAAARKVLRRSPTRKLIEVTKVGHTVYVESEYTARGSNGFEIRRFARDLANGAGRHVEIDDVNLHSKIEHKVVSP